MLYLKTIEDLGNRIGSNDPYEILGASALIRKLFLDNQPLVDQANRQYKLKIAFNVCLPTPNPPGLPEPALFSIQDGLDPNTSRLGKSISQLKRDQFFKIVVLIINGKKYTIKDVILFEANIMGGVHAGSPKKEKEEVLKSLNDKLSIGGYTSSLRQVQAIGRVILTSLAPLTQRIESNLS